MSRSGRPTGITVVKRDHAGKAVFQYDGEVVARGETWVCLEARFQRDTFDAGYMVYRRGDLFMEWFYTDRWYNVFRIQDARDETLKGWYCNITRPAEIGETVVAADDLALDVFVSPDGAILILDEDEFAALPLGEAERHAAHKAVEAIRQLVAARQSPFNAEQHQGASRHPRRSGQNG